MTQPLGNPQICDEVIFFLDKTITSKVYAYPNIKHLVKNLCMSKTKMFGACTKLIYQTFIVFFIVLVQQKQPILHTEKDLGHLPYQSAHSKGKF